MEPWSLLPLSVASKMKKNGLTCCFFGWNCDTVSAVGAVKKLVKAHVWKNPRIARHRCMREKDSRCTGGGIFPDVSMRDV